MYEDLVQFAFVGSVIAGMSLALFLLMFAISPLFREEVLKDWNRK